MTPALSIERTSFEEETAMAVTQSSAVTTCKLLVGDEWIDSSATEFSEV